MGPAGENRVSFASVLAEEDSSGGAGFGAVMGSKKLKAVAVMGAKRLKPADPAKLKKLSGFLLDIKKKQPLEPPSPPQDMVVKRKACFGCIAGCDRYVMETANGKRGKYMCASGPLYEASADRLGALPVC